VEFHRSFPGGFSLGAKATFSSQAGPSVTMSGLSDLFLSAGFTGDGKTSFTAGLKIPLNEGNKMKDGLPLPMNYQTSLATFDAIVGIGYRLEGLDVTAAVQQPISQNPNTFIATTYPAGSEFTAFPTTNEFRRKGDVLLCVNYPLDAGSGGKMTPGLLPIYHLGDDEYTETGTGGDVRKEISGSGGLTVNGNLFLEYVVDGSSRVEFSFGGRSWHGTSARRASSGVLSPGRNTPRRSSSRTARRTSGT
jgi:hypothetical protein